MWNKLFQMLVKYFLTYRMTKKLSQSLTFHLPRIQPFHIILIAEIEKKEKMFCRKQSWPIPLFWLDDIFISIQVSLNLRILDSDLHMARAARKTEMWKADETRAQSATWTREKGLENPRTS